MAVSNSIGAASIAVKYVIDNNTTKSVTNSINNLKNQAPKLQTAFTSAFSKIGLAISAAFSIAAITKFAKATSALYKTQMIAETKLETVMKQRMNATQSEIRAIKELSMEYQHLGVIGDEVALTGIAQLATFAKNTKSLETILPNFNNALVGMYGLDVTTSQATQLANQLGKALANGNLSALTRSGMTFTDAEKKAFEMANELERAEIISQALVNNFGKMNEVVANTPLGRIKQLSNAWNDVLEKFGEGFVNIASAFVPLLMKIVGWLDVVASMFAKVSEAIARVFGGKFIKNQGISGISETTDGLTDLADGYEAVGTSASEAKESLASFDNVVQLSDTSSSGSGAGSGGDTDTGASLGGFIEEELASTEIEGFIDKIKSAFEKVKEFISNTFDLDFTELKDNFKKIGQKIKEIFEGLKPSGKNFISSFAQYLLTSASSLYSVAKSIIEALTGGIALWLEQGKERIIKQWSEILDNFSNAFDNLTVLIYNIGSLLSGFFSLESTKQAIANALETIEGFITGTYLLVSDIVSAIIEFISKTIDENFVGLNDFFTNISELLEKVTEFCKKVVLDCFASLHENFEKYVKPAFEQFQEGFSYAFGKVLEAWNEYILPFLNNVADGFNRLWDEHLKSFVDEVLGMVGAFIEAVASIYNFAIKPFMKYWKEGVGFVCNVLSSLWVFIETKVGDIIDIFKGLATALKGVFEVIAGIFQGDGQKVCDGLEKIFKGVVNSIGSAFSTLINTIIDSLNYVIRIANNIKIPGTELSISIPELKRISIPKLADGGIVYRQTDFGGFIAGEAGAEAIIPLENSSYTKVLAREIVKGIVEAGVGGDTYNIQNAFGDDRSMERLVGKIAEKQRQINAKRGVVAYA